MTEPNVVLPFPQNIDEEQARRIMAEANRLAGLSPAERMFMAKRSAERLGIAVKDMKSLVEIVVKENEKKARDQKAELQRHEQQIEKQRIAAERARKAEQEAIDKAAKEKAKVKEKGLAEVAKLPVAHHEARLVILARQLDEDLTTLRGELSELIDAEREARPATPAAWSVEA